MMTFVPLEFVLLLISQSLFQEPDNKIATSDYKNHTTN
jgi:hypothetical protein